MTITPVFLAGDTSLVSKAASALGTPYYVTNLYTAVAGGQPNRLSVYCSTGTPAPSVVPVVYAYNGTNPTTCIGYGPQVSIPASKAAGWYDLSLSTLVPTIVAGTSYVFGVICLSGTANFWKDSGSAVEGAWYAATSATYTAPPTSPFGSGSANTGNSAPPGELYATALYQDTTFRAPARPSNTALHRAASY